MADSTGAGVSRRSEMAATEAWKSSGGRTSATHGPRAGCAPGSRRQPQRPAVQPEDQDRPTDGDRAKGCFDRSRASRPCPRPGRTPGHPAVRRAGTETGRERHAIRIDVRHLHAGATTLENEPHQQPLGPRAHHQDVLGQGEPNGGAPPGRPPLARHRRGPSGSSSLIGHAQRRARRAVRRGHPAGSCRWTAAARRPRSSRARHWGQARQATLGSMTTVSPTRAGDTLVRRSRSSEGLVAHDPGIVRRRSSAAEHAQVRAAQPTPPTAIRRRPGRPGSATSSTTISPGRTSRAAFMSVPPAAAEDFGRASARSRPRRTPASRSSGRIRRESVSMCHCGRIRRRHDGGVTWL